ncbi:hypothetical protein C5167_027546 [Papaver somniferum]|nr:hypothetical protein C5167_027546 [Papaver somniferum]
MDISWVVNLERHTCTCKEWKVSGIPCVHVICASLRLRPKTYDQRIVLIYNVVLTPSVYAESKIVKPLKCGRPPGRPRSQRRRDRDEGGSSRKYMCGKCCVYGHNRSSCKGAAAENQELAPATFTGPHVRPDPTTRPPPPPPPLSTSADETNASQAPRNEPRTRGGGRKRRGGETQPHVPTATAPSSTTTAPSSTTTAPSSTSAISPVPPTSESTVPTPGGRGRGSRGGTGGRGNRGGRGVAFAPVPPIITATPVPPVQVAASTTIAFGRSVSNSSTTTRGGALRGRGERGRARGQIVHRRNGRIVGIGILQDEGPTLAREPTSVQRRWASDERWWRIFFDSWKGKEAKDDGLVFEIMDEKEVQTKPGCPFLEGDFHNNEVLNFSRHLSLPHNKQSDFEPLFAYLKKNDIFVNCRGLVINWFPRTVRYRYRSYSWSPELLNLSSYGIHALDAQQDNQSDELMNDPDNADKLQALEKTEHLNQEKNDKQALEKTVSHPHEQLNQDKQALEKSISDLHEQLNQVKNDKQALEKRVSDLNEQLNLEKNGMQALEKRVSNLDEQLNQVESNTFLGWLDDSQCGTMSRTICELCNYQRPRHASIWW